MNFHFVPHLEKLVTMDVNVKFSMCKKIEQFDLFFSYFIFTYFLPCCNWIVTNYLFYHLLICNGKVNNFSCFAL